MGTMARPERLTVDDEARFAQAMRALAPMSDAALAAAFPSVVARSLARGGVFLHVGDRATEVAVVARGFLRELFLFPDGTERTKAFVFEGAGTGSMADLMRGGPSLATIVAEEPSRILCWPYASYTALRARSPEWERAHHALIEDLFRAKARREYELLGLDAEGRYAALLARMPHIEGRVSGKHLASYLGITPVHLSRLRRRRANAT